VVFAFLRNYRATIIPSVAVPLSLVGTFGLMYLFGYSIDNLSLMALTICTGFVVDDAIVVIENISRHMENGLGPYHATMKGCGEIGFTVLSMSASLVAVFIPILMMSGIVRRQFREFAVVLSGHRSLSFRVAYHYAHDVRAVPQARGEKEARIFLPTFGALVQRHAPWLRPFASLGFASPVPDPLRHDFYRRPERLHVQARQQGLFPAAGHRAH
jgi:hypothetical protein